MAWYMWPMLIQTCLLVIDPKTNTVVATITVGGSPSGVEC